MNKALVIIGIGIVALSANAQKLPQVQQVSLRAPVNIKIDGKAKDWGEKFEANNTTTELLYTIANDDKRLYLIAQAENPDVMNRISNGGIKLIIQTNGTKSDKDAPFIKFPFLQKGQNYVIDFRNYQNTGPGDKWKVLAPAPASNEEADRIMDSLAKMNNTKLSEISKLIYTSGLAGIETLLPVYNENGIEAASAVDKKKLYTWEMAVDLNLLGLSANKVSKFLYHLVINDEPSKYTLQPVIYTSMSGPDGPFNEERLRAENAAIQAKIGVRTATVGFWGEYTLAKK